MIRVLVWGMSNNRAGTEAVIANIVNNSSEGIDYDFLTFEELTNHPDMMVRGKVCTLPNKKTAYPAYKKAVTARALLKLGLKEVRKKLGRYVFDPKVDAVSKNKVCTFAISPMLHDLLLAAHGRLNERHKKGSKL